MPNLTVVARKAWLSALGGWGEPRKLRINLFGTGEPPPDTKWRSTFEFRHGHKWRVDGWEVAIRVQLCRDDPDSARIPKAPKSGKALVGMMFAGWEEPEKDGVVPSAWVEIYLNVAQEQFDRLAAALPHDVDWQVHVYTPLRFPDQLPGESYDDSMLRTGLVHGHDPDGRDLIWDTSKSPETEIESFAIGLSSKSKEAIAESVAKDRDEFRTVLDSIRSTQELTYQSNRRIFWLVLTLGTLILLAMLAN